MADSIEQGCLSVGEGVSISGKITLTGRLDVDGMIEGELSAKEMHVGGTGKVTGKINVTIADVRGEILDTLVVEDTLILRSTARVKGTISYKTLQIEQGAMLEGTLARIGGQAPRFNAASQQTNDAKESPSV